MAIDFGSLYPWSALENVTIDGQAMKKVPKFYVKNGTIPNGRENAGKKAKWVSEKALSGYHIHPAFVKNGEIMDCFYIARFEGYNEGSNKCGSASGKTPWVNLGGFESAKTYCANRNTDASSFEKSGWHLQNIYEVAAVNLLLMIELETPNVQTAIAMGNVSSSAAQATGATAAVWRDIHEWWGNVWEHVDGLTTDANGIYQIFSNQGDGTYVSTGVTNPASGWITEMSEAKGTNFDLSDVFLPSATDGTEGNGTYGDYHWTGKNTVLYRGGSWNHGSRYGAFTFHVSDAASHSMSGIGLRLAKSGVAAA